MRCLKVDRGTEVVLLESIAGSQAYLDKVDDTWGKAEQMTLERLYIATIILESLRARD